MWHAPPAAKQYAHLAAVHVILRVRLDALFELLHVHKVYKLVEVYPLHEEIILLTEECIDFMFERIVTILFICDGFFFLLNFSLHLLNVIVFICEIRLEVQFIFLLVGALHEWIFLYEFILKVFEKPIIDFFETQHMLIVVRERNALTYHYIQFKFIMLTFGSDTVGTWLKDVSMFSFEHLKWGLDVLAHDVLCVADSAGWRWAPFAFRFKFLLADAVHIVIVGLASVWVLHLQAVALVFTPAAYESIGI
jgi:hypothetical protein